MAGSTGLEPAASAVTGQRSNQLNYDPAFGYTGLAETLVAVGDWLANQTGSVKPFVRDLKIVTEEKACDSDQTAQTNAGDFVGDPGRLSC